MAGFTVTCAGCGRRFSPNAERSFYDRAGQCYACSQCLDRAGIRAAGSKPRTKVGTWLRVGFAALSIFTAFSSIEDGDGVWFTCLLIGLALLLWQFWPQLRGLLRQKRNHAAMLKLREGFQAQQAEDRAKEAAKPKLCPHCGATTTGFTCEYCGMPVEVK